MQIKKGKRKTFLKFEDRHETVIQTGWLGRGFFLCLLVYQPSWVN